MVEEERIIRRKRAYKALPIESAKYCLAQAGLHPEEIDILAVGWSPLSFKMQSYDQQYVNKFINSKSWEGRFNPEIVYVPHHIAHAASSYYVSNIDSGVIVVIDGHGENISTSIGFCENGKIKIDQTFPISHSLGHFYEAVSCFLGLGNNSAGKLMGLASYGNEKHLFDGVIQCDDLGYNIKIMDDIQSNLDFKSTISIWNKYLFDKFGSDFGANYIWDPVNLNSIYQIKEFEKASNIASSAQFV